MMRASPIVALLALLATSAQGAQEETYDYFQAHRLMIRNGVQAVLMCNGLFTSHRSLEQVFGQELAYLVRFGGAVGTSSGGEPMPWKLRIVWRPFFFTGFLYRGKD